MSFISDSKKTLKLISPFEVIAQMWLTLFHRSLQVGSLFFVFFPMDNMTLTNLTLILG
jgi:hypothetical protein